MKITKKYIIRLLKAIADDEKIIQEIATNFETDVQTVKICLAEAETTIGKLYSHIHVSINFVNKKILYLQK